MVLPRSRQPRSARYVVAHALMESNRGRRLNHQPRRRTWTVHQHSALRTILVTTAGASAPLPGST